MPLSRALSAGRVGCWDKAPGVASGARTGQGGGSGRGGWEGLGGTPPGEGAGQRSAQVCELSSIRRQHLHPCRVSEAPVFVSVCSRGSQRMRTPCD